MNGGSVMRARPRWRVGRAWRRISVSHQGGTLWRECYLGWVTRPRRDSAAADGDAPSHPRQRPANSVDCWRRHGEQRGTPHAFYFHGLQQGLLRSRALVPSVSGRLHLQRRPPSTPDLFDLVLELC
jgi:hypothetical protein